MDVNSYNDLIPFQFHKVRLKDFVVVTESLILQFQFHKVRLKVLVVMEVGTRNLFQFHKVRLKVSTFQISLTDLPCFNSIRYD